MSRDLLHLAELSAIDLPPVADAQHEDENHVVLDVADQAVISNPILPQISLGSMERTAEPARIFPGLDPFAEKTKDSLLTRSAQPG